MKYLMFSHARTALFSSKLTVVVSYHVPYPTIGILAPLLRVILGTVSGSVMVRYLQLLSQ